MKNLFFSCLLVLTAVSTLFAQKTTNCGYIIPPKKKVTLRNNFASVYEARDIVKKMLDTIKWKENFTLQEKNGINNAYATIINNKRWIIYDNEFLESLDDYASTKWASISVMAHEVGHHKHGHVFTGKGSTVPTEIEADDFSGYVMAKLGATLEQSVAAIKAISTEQASATHPAKKDRVAAITKGWNRAAAEIKAGIAASSSGSTGTGTNPSTGTGTKPPTSSGTGTKPPTSSGTTTPGTIGGTKPGTGTGSNTPTAPQVPESENYIILSMQNVENVNILLSDDGKNYTQQLMEPGVPFAFKFEIYKYGWLKLPHYNGYRIYKLEHGKDYSILFNVRKQFWTVVQVPTD